MLARQGFNFILRGGVNHKQTNKHSTEIEVTYETLEEVFAKDVLTG
jgi:hypothetical protein